MENCCRVISSHCIYLSVEKAEVNLPPFDHKSGAPFLGAGVPPYPLDVSALCEAAISRVESLQRLAQLAPAIVQLVAKPVVNNELLPGSDNETVKIAARIFPTMNVTEDIYPPLISRDSLEVLIANLRESTVS